MKISAAHKHVLRHALGLTKAKKPYRKHFCTGEGSTDWPLCQDLVSLGMMTCQENPALPEGDRLFIVTPKGEKLIRPPKTELAALRKEVLRPHLIEIRITERIAALADYANAYEINHLSSMHRDIIRGKEALAEAEKFLEVVPAGDFDGNRRKYYDLLTQ